MEKVKFSGVSKFLAGVIVGAVVFSGSAVAINNYVSDNTPENGYLLCANIKTKAVTFPNKLSCPSGTKALDLGAVTGVEGPEGPMGPQGFTGPQGPQGPAGSSSANAITKLYSVKVPPRDIVFDGNATCPPVVEYSTDDQSLAAEEVEALPEAALIVQMLADYSVLRDQAKACK